MLDDKTIYVIDTNVIVDYVDVIFGQVKRPLGKPTIDLSEAHLVIPTAVIRELSRFKKEKSERSKAARVALKKIRALDRQEAPNMGASYQLMHPLKVPSTKQVVSVLPVHKNFKDPLPFSPSDEDMDGQIILTALTAMFILENRPIDGTYGKANAIHSPSSNKVILLTNDNGLAIRAKERGIKTKRFSYEYPEPYTGRRDVIVPKLLFHTFYYEQQVTLEEWERWMPDQPKLVANEFIIMKLENEMDYPSDYDKYNDPQFSYIGRYDVRENAIVPLRYIWDFPVHLNNPGQAIYAEALMDDRYSAVICSGPAGSGKTYMATVYGYQACKKGKYIGVTLVPCDSGSKLGALPGDLDEKMDPDVQPIKNALRNFLLNEDKKIRAKLDSLRRYGTGQNGNGNRDTDEKKSIKARLEDRVEMIYSNWFSNIPIDHARGRDFSYELAIYDEFQDQTVSQADTLIKRLGADGKIIITGDIHQIHAPYIDESSNGLVYASRLLLDSDMVAQVCFTDEEIIRHPLVKMVAKRQNNAAATSNLPILF